MYVTWCYLWKVADAEYKADAIENVWFTAAIETSDGIKQRVKANDLCTLCIRLETIQRDCFDKHGDNVKAVNEQWKHEGWWASNNCIRYKWWAYITDTASLLPVSFICLGVHWCCFVQVRLWIFVLVFIQFGCNLFSFYSLLVLLNIFSSSSRSRERIADLFRSRSRK